MQKLSGISDEGRRENNSKYVLDLLLIKWLVQKFPSSHIVFSIMTNFSYPGFLFSGGDPYKDLNFFFFPQEERNSHTEREKSKREDRWSFSFWALKERA